MKKISFALFVVVGIGFMIWAMLFQAGIIGGPVKVTPGEKAAQTLPGGDWQELKSTPIPVVYTAVATVSSDDEISIFSRLPIARIIEIKVKSGDHVKKGDLLVQLEDDDLRTIVRSTEENLKGAQARLEFAKSEFERNRGLLPNKTISQSEYDASRTSLNTTQAEVSMLMHSLEKAKIDFGYTRIYAPFDGIVSEKRCEAGELATPERAILEFFDPSKLQLNIPVRESLVSHLRVGDRHNVRIDALGRDFVVQVKEIVPSVDPNSRTFTVKAALIGDTTNVMPGMFARCEIIVGYKNAILVPKSSVRTVGQLEYLTVKAENDVVEQLIYTVPFDEKRLEVVSGVKEGEYVLNH
ncbi:MAG: efflux RND transporter periplasmic adaptor subunit [Planctomycetaceae bacterium]|nr:efflux RND transporter periplasmic adaptor subunit [Planctomycetaceae bacterium]